MAAEPSTKEDFIALWRAIFPESYTAPIEGEDGNGAGFDIPSMMGAMWGSVEESMNGMQQSYFLLPHSIQTGDISSGPRKATGTLQLRRTAPIYSPVTVPAGTLVVASSTDPGNVESTVARYFTTQSVTIESLGPLELPVEAEFAGYAWNLKACPEVPGHGKGLPDDPDQPFPGSPYFSGPSPWYRFRFNQPVTSNGEPGVIVSQSSISGTNLSSEDVDATIVISTDLDPAAALTARQVTSVSDSGVVTFTPALPNPLPVGTPIQWRSATFEELGLSVTQDLGPSGDISGGRAPTLDSIGADRMAGRSIGEGDASYRARLSSLSDIISPSALECIIGETLAPCGVPWELLEIVPLQTSVETPGYIMGFTSDVHPADYGSICGPSPKGSQSEYVGRGGVVLPTDIHLFVVCVEAVNLAHAIGLAYDEGPYPNAWDEGFYDGDMGFEDAAFLECIQLLWKRLNEARAAGVGFVIALKTE